MAKAANATVSPVILTKASDILSAQLRAMILGGRFAPGHPLPAERELVVQSGLSRSSVRESLRLLEAQGLIRTRAGRGGGAIVTLPHRETMVRSVELFLRAQDIRLNSLYDCRLAVEPMLAKLAAENRTDLELAQLRDLHTRFEESVGDVGDYKRINLEWHLAVARASRNEPLTALIEAVASPILESSGYQHVTTLPLRQSAIRAHGAITQAIDEGNGEAAFGRMQRHIGAYVEAARQDDLDRSAAPAP